MQLWVIMVRALDNATQVMDKTVKTIIFWVVIAFAALMLWQFVKTAQTSPPAPEISYSQFLSEVESGTVLKVRISGTSIQGTYRDGGGFRVNAPAEQYEMLQTLRSKNVEIWYAEGESNSTKNWLINLLPLILLAVLWFLMIRQMRSRNNPQAPNAPGVVNGSWAGKS